MVFDFSQNGISVIFEISDDKKVTLIYTKSGEYLLLDFFD